MSGIKRKSPYGSMSASPAPHARGASAPVKTEGDVKRMRGGELRELYRSNHRPREHAVVQL